MPSVLQHRKHLKDLYNDWAAQADYSGEDLSDEDMYAPSSCSEASEESSSTDGWGNVEGNRENQIHGVVEEKVKTPAKRIARRCPLKGCKSKVIHLPRHLREVHKWTRERAKNATSSFGVRKSFFPKPVQPEVSVQQKKKDYHRHRPCPIAGCHSVVKRLPNHIQQVHKDIKKGSVRYKQVLRQARSLKTWTPLNADLDNPEVEYAAMPNNTEHREMIDLDVQLHEENEVEFVEDNDGEDEEEIFRAFCEWLQTADGGRRDRKMAKQHSSQVRKILVIIDPEKRLSSLFNKNLIRDKFLVDYAEKMYKPDTVKAHLLSLRNFCSFVKTEEPSSVTVDVATIEKIEEKARLWSSSYKKDSNRRHLEKQNEDLQKLVTPEMVSQFENGESTRTAVAYIGQLSGAH